MPAGGPADVREALGRHGYLADEGLATVVYLALVMRRPLLLEGDAGVGKTEVAKVLARWTGGELLRVQCYEGIDVAQAVYEWDYSRQLLHLRSAEARAATTGVAVSEDVEDELYSERFLVRRPLLAAITTDPGSAAPVLLVDEVDRADDDFEAFLLEVLSEYAITVPELGTFRADVPPIVVITSNRTRDLHDALKRRCLYHWVDHPSFEREVEIITLKVPGVGTVLARQIAAAVEQLRVLSLYKPPGVAETIDWAEALGALGRPGWTRPPSRPPSGPCSSTGRTPTKRVRRGSESLCARRRSALVEPLEAGLTGGLSGGWPVNREDGLTAGQRPERLAVAFSRLLRGHGVHVPAGASLIYAEAMSVLGFSSSGPLYWAGRATLVNRPEDVAVYDEVFSAFFLRRAASGQAHQHTFRALALVDAPAERADGGEDDTSWPDPGQDRGRQQVRYSRVEILRRKDFASCSAEELAELERLMAMARLRGPLRRSRRYKPVPRAGHRPDMPRTVRRALRAGGEPVRRAWKAPGERPRRIVILCDVSGSMEPYARVLVRFLHLVVSGRAQVEAFTVGTRLTRVTRELALHDPDMALALAGGRVVDWSGGTRLGEALREFNDRWGAAGPGSGVGDRGLLRRVGPRRPGSALGGDGPLVEGGAQARVDEPIESLARLRAFRPRYGGGPAVCRRFRRGALISLAGRTGLVAQR